VLLRYPLSDPTEQVSALIMVKINLPFADIFLFTAANYKETENRKWQQCKELVTMVGWLILKLFEDALPTTDVT
jgi:hypothetical protein